MYYISQNFSIFCHIIDNFVCPFLNEIGFLDGKPEGNEGWNQSHWLVGNRGRLLIKHEISAISI